MKEVEILLVEDNPEDAELTLRALRRNNLVNNIRVVEDGELALDYLFARGSFAGREKENKPKLILLDLKLPKISGLEVLKVIKQDENLKKIPVVMLTSSSEDSDIQKSYDLGVNSYIEKPVDFKQFISAVDKLGFYWLLLNKQPGN